MSKDKINIFQMARPTVRELKPYASAKDEFKYFDPEANSFGRSNVRVDYSSYPLARTFLMGINVRF